MKKDDMSEFDKGFQEGFNALGDGNGEDGTEMSSPFAAIIVIVLVIVVGFIIMAFMPEIFDMVRSRILGY